MARILLVEDNEMNRDMLARRLSKRGHQVSTAVDGKDGFQRARAELPELVLLDLSLPEVSGWDVAGMLRADPSTARIPIIALSAHALFDERPKALAAGCDEYETKPIDLERLLGKISALLPAKG